MSTGTHIPTDSRLEVAGLNGAGTPPETLYFMSQMTAQDAFLAQGGVAATRQLISAGKGGADFAVSLADLNRMLPKSAKGVFRAQQAWAELYLSSGLLPGLHGQCQQQAPQVVARAAFEFATEGPAAIDFSGRLTLKDGPALATVWTVVVQAQGTFEPRGGSKLMLGGRLTVVGTLPLSLVVRTVP